MLLKPREEGGETDQSSRQVKKRLVDVRSTFIADHQPAETVEPGLRALNHPAIPAQPFTRVDAPPSDARGDAPFLQGFAAAWEVVGLVGVELLGPPSRSAPAGTLDRLDGVDQFLEDLGVMDIRRGEDHC